jgi:hypothetical protein
MAYRVHYFTQLGYPRVIAERSSGLCHQRLHAQKIYPILYYIIRVIYIMSSLRGESTCFVCAPACDILYMCGVHSFTATSWQQARNCVLYVQSPSM